MQYQEEFKWKTRFYDFSWYELFVVTMFQIEQGNILPKLHSSFNMIYDDLTLKLIMCH